MLSGRIVVYAGKGSSHSWTWTADLLESAGAFDCEFVDEHGLARAFEQAVATLVVSGGDGFEIAGALAPRAFAAIERNVRAGGIYVGMCAGAYLPLPSSVEPFDRFNLSTTKIRNVQREIRDDMLSSPRTGVRYGSCSIVHPVRGELELEGGGRRFKAPVYGGPVFEEPDRDSVLLRYSGFTPRTSLQLDRFAASEMVLGHPAVVSCLLDEGRMILAGPHLEHPDYPQANNVFLSDFIGVNNEHVAREQAVQGVRDNRGLDRSVADLRVAVLGLERETFLVGAKLWDGGRLMELVSAIARRRHSLGPDASQAVIGLLDRTREELLSVGPEKIAYSDSAPSLLVEAARLSVNCHFEAMKG